MFHLLTEKALKEQSKRVGIWLENLNALEGAKSIVIISHAGNTRSILSHALKLNMIILK